MQFGKVKFFDSREEKRFGFVVGDDGSETFFHLNDYLAPDNSDRGARHIPVKGDKLVYRLAHGKKGAKANPWAFADEMPVKLPQDGTSITISWRDIPTTYPAQLQDGDSVIHIVDNAGIAGFGPKTNWVEIIFRPRTRELFSISCWDGEKGDYTSSLPYNDELLPSGVTITE